MNSESEYLAAQGSSFSIQTVFIPNSCAGFKFLAISSKNIQYCGSILKFSITFSYGCLEGLGTKSESTISNTPSKSFSIPILFVTFAACAFDPLVNIIFYH